MRVVLALVVCYFLVCCIYTQSIAPALTAEQASRPRTKLVQKVVDVTQTYSLPTVPLYTWQPFPDMTIQFRLYYAQYVDIDYNIVLWTNGNHYLCTRVIVDKVENRRFRATTGDTKFHTNFQSHRVWLTAGLH